MNWTRLLLNNRRWLALSSQIAILAITFYFSFLLRFDFRVAREYQLLFLYMLPLVLLLKILILSLAGLMRGWWRFAGLSDLLDIVKATGISSLLVMLIVQFFLSDVGFPRSVIVIDFFLSVCALGGLRFLVRIYFEKSHKHKPRRNTIIVGAGSAGTKLARQLQDNSQLDLNPVGYLDDDQSKKGLKIQGIRVLGKTADVCSIVSRAKAVCAVIAMPSVNGEQLRHIVEECSKCSVDLKILPSIAQRINGESIGSKMRSVRIEDLLGRTPVTLDLDAMRRQFQDHVIMVTGAGGSIGSELSRQLAEFRPRKLLLFERGESDLHAIDIELRTQHRDLQYVPLVGDILDVRTLRDVVAEYRPDSVFHAAAYKHVPMMEKNCFQAVVNNVFGTYNVALVAKQYGVKRFLMISSDKAVNPTNVMGVTKRIAELVILGLQHEQNTQFVSVRFGNVLGSNGSVLPLFEQQLARGGPLTVTHPEARRYFMTIPEAVQLVLQASTMGKGGEIFVLDMGSPVLVAELAKNLIRLSGRDPDRDVHIVYTGLRPGEKLFEELQLDAEGIKKTSHPKLRVLEGGPVDFSKVSRWLDDLSNLVDTKSVFGLVRKLQEIVPEYTPSKELVSLSEFDRHDLFSGYKRAQLELFHAATVAGRVLVDRSQAA